MASPALGRKARLASVIRAFLFALPDTPEVGVHPRPEIKRFTPDDCLVFLDLVMAGMDRRQFLDELRRRPASRAGRSALPNAVTQPETPRGPLLIAPRLAYDPERG